MYGMEYLVSWQGCPLAMFKDIEDAENYIHKSLLCNSLELERIEDVIK